jgi:serine protease Do
VGIVSALSRMLGNAIQTDAKLSPANYGGPLCDIHGRVIGICVPMAQRPGELAGIELYDSGVGFAVPKHRIDEIVSVLKTGTSFYRGWLGISVNPRRRDALVIAKVANPSPMQSAGVQPGDKVITANGKDIRHLGELIQTLYMLPAGTPVELLMEADESGYQIEVTLARNADLGPLSDSQETADPSESPPPEDD